MTAFTEVSVKVDGEAAEAVAEVLRPFAFQEGVVLEQLGDELSPEPLAMEPEVTVKIFIPRDEDNETFRRRIEEILYHLGRLYPVPPPSFKILEETDWANAWKEHYHPFRVGEKIWIQPSWIDPDQTNANGEDKQKPDDIVIVLDPGMAFGTGLHPTTQKCLRALENIVQSGDRVLDVGTGSGILAIASVKLGAAYVVGVDTDDIAVKSAAANAKQNNLETDITFWQGDLSSVTERNWDIVVVNILAPVIHKLLSAYDLLAYIKNNGRLILSGIIDTQVDDIEQQVVSSGGIVEQRLNIRDWVTLIVRSNVA